MSARYGSKTRSGEAVSDLGRRPTGGAGGGLNFYEEEFLAPGTWTWPGNTSFVEVLIVGGGGGGSYANPPVPPAGVVRSGSGGGVGVFTVPVSAPVPVTVGAGGVAGTAPSPAGTSGGYSAFGTVTPPVPSIPVNLAIVGGGVGADTPFTATFYAGGYNTMPQTAGIIYQYASSGASDTGPIDYSWGGGGGYRYADTSSGTTNRFGFGAGGVASQNHAVSFQRGFVMQNGNPGNNFVGPTVVNNTGNGGSGAIANSNGTIHGTDGSSGIVIVRWSE